MSPRVRPPARSLDHQCARSSSDPYCTWRQIASHTKTSLAAGSRLEAVLLPLACLLCGAASLTPRRSAGSQRLRPISNMSYRRSAHVGRSSFTTVAGIALGPSPPASNFSLRGRSSAPSYRGMTRRQARAEEFPRLFPKSAGLPQGPLNAQLLPASSSRQPLLPKREVVNPTATRVVLTLICSIAALAVAGTESAAASPTCLGHKATIVGTSRRPPSRYCGARRHRRRARTRSGLARAEATTWCAADRGLTSSSSGEERTRRPLVGETTASKAATAKTFSMAEKGPTSSMAAPARTHAGWGKTFSTASRLRSTGPTPNGTAHTRANHSTSRATPRHSKTTSTRSPPSQTARPAQGRGTRRRDRIRPWRTSSAPRRLP